MKKTALTITALSISTTLLIPATAFAQETNRISGTDRFQTAIEISDVYGKTDTVYLARGDDQADAVAGGKLRGGPALLVNDSDQIRADVATQIKKLGATKIVVLGGTGAISDETVKAVAGKAAVERLSGTDRYATAAKISQKLNPKTAKKVYLANGKTLVDALVGGQIPDNNPILLTNGTGTLPQATIKEIRRLKPSEIIALGGSAAVTEKELSAATYINGTGGGIPRELAETKLKTDLAAELRKSNMAVEGWRTITGKNTDEFLKSACLKKNDTPENETEKTKQKLELTWPKILPSEIADNCAEKIFKIDSTPTPGTKQEAEKNAKNTPTINGKQVANFKGWEQISKEKPEPSSNYKKILALLTQAKAKLAYTNGPSEDDIQTYMGSGGATGKRIAGTNRYETALAIANSVYPAGDKAKAVYTANGYASADATVAGFIDNKPELAGPVLLVEKQTIPNNITGYLKLSRQQNPELAGKFKALGGTAMISDAVISQGQQLLK